MPFHGLEIQPRHHLANPFLRSVVAQVSFPHLYEIESPGEQISTFQKSLAADYPNALPREEAIFAISIGQTAQQNQSPPKGPYRFRSSDDRWLVSLSPEFVALEVGTYDTFDEFESRLGDVLQVVADVLDPSAVGRVGLRYINEVQLGSNDEWLSLFTPELLGLFADDAVSGHMLQGAVQLTLALDDHFLTARHGLVLSEEAKAYALDLDAFCSPTSAFSVDEILPRVRTLKQTCWSFFRASVTSRFLEKAGASE